MHFLKIVLLYKSMHTYLSLLTLMLKCNVHSIVIHKMACGHLQIKLDNEIGDKRIPSIDYRLLFAM